MWSDAPEEARAQANKAERTLTLCWHGLAHLDALAGERLPNP